MKNQILNGYEQEAAPLLPPGSFDLVVMDDNYKPTRKERAEDGLFGQAQHNWGMRSRSDRWLTLSEEDKTFLGHMARLKYSAQQMTYAEVLLKRLRNGRDRLKEDRALVHLCHESHLDLVVAVHRHVFGKGFGWAITYKASVTLRNGANRPMFNRVGVVCSHTGKRHPWNRIAWPIFEKWFGTTEFNRLKSRYRYEDADGDYNWEALNQNPNTLNGGTWPIQIGKKTFRITASDWEDGLAEGRYRISRGGNPQRKRYWNPAGWNGPRYDIKLDRPEDKDPDIGLLQKPLRLLEMLILQLTDPNDRVLDLFAGTGTTALAALMHSRYFTVNDCDVQACVKIQARLERFKPGSTSPAVLDYLPLPIDAGHYQQSRDAFPDHWEGGALAERVFITLAGGRHDNRPPFDGVANLADSQGHFDIYFEIKDHKGTTGLNKGERAKLSNYVKGATDRVLQPRDGLIIITSHEVTSQIHEWARAHGTHAVWSNGERHRRPKVLVVSIRELLHDGVEILQLPRRLPSGMPDMPETSEDQDVPVLFQLFCDTPEALDTMKRGYYQDRIDLALAIEDERSRHEDPTL